MIIIKVLLVKASFASLSASVKNQQQPDKSSCLRSKMQCTLTLPHSMMLNRMHTDQLTRTKAVKSSAIVLGEMPRRADVVFTYWHQSAESAVTPVESCSYTKPDSSTVEGSSPSRPYSILSYKPIPFPLLQTTRVGSTRPTIPPDAFDSPNG